jgi:hypothetical protein
MLGYPPIPLLEPRQVKDLVQQIRVLRQDFPSFSVAELAEEWATAQRWRLAEQRPTPFAEWLETADWERGFALAAAVAERVTEQKAQQRALRQKAKAWKKERRP